MNAQNSTIDLLAQTLTLNVSDQGRGRPFLLLHGGAGPASMTGFAAGLAADERVIVPTHPGFAGTRQPDWCASIRDLTGVYLALIERLDLRDVVIVGNSIGGWTACEMALRASPSISAIVLLNAVGIDPGIEGWAPSIPAELSPAERAARAFFNPAKYAPPPSPEAAPMMASNFAALQRYAGAPFTVDRTLRPRLGAIEVPTLVLWGEADRIVTVEYGQIYAQSIPHAHFERVPEAGHMPQVEQGDLVRGRISQWLKAG